MRTILNRAGGQISQNKGRYLAVLEREHNFLVERGFVLEWKIAKASEKSTDPLDDIWEITMPADHPALVHKQKRNQKTTG